jgi:hypothetical protein
MSILDAGFSWCMPGDDDKGLDDRDCWPPDNRPGAKEKERLGNDCSG